MLLTILLFIYLFGGVYTANVAYSVALDQRMSSPVGTALATAIVWPFIFFWVVVRSVARALPGSFK